MLAVEDNRALLAMVAERLQQQSEDFLVARYASDSFLIWLPPPTPGRFRSSRRISLSSCPGPMSCAASP